jgi:PKD repeat protein
VQNWRRWLVAIVGTLVVLSVLPVTAAHAAVSNVLGNATVDSPNGTDFTWTCTVNPGGASIWVTGASWNNPSNPAYPQQFAGAVGMPVTNNRTNVSGSTPVVLTFKRATSLENQSMGYRCIWYSSATTNTQLGKDATAKFVTTTFDNDPPVAVLTQPAPVDEDASVTLTAGGSSDPDNNISTYDWDFGDGTTSTGHAWSFVDHVYADPGSYEVTVTVRDAGGLSDTDTKTLVVNEVNVAPEAGLTADLTTVVVGNEVVADASTSTDANAGDVLSYTFDFGDGTIVGPQSGATASHTYTVEGTYNVTVTVSDGSLTDASDPIAIVVEPEPRQIDVGASSNRPGTASKLASMQALDDDLATVAGLPTTAPVADFWHVYNGSTMPTSWSTSGGAQSAANGWDSMTNIKWASGEIRTDAGRTKFNGFLASIPASLKVYLIGQHEPENDPNAGDAAWREAWRLDQAEFVKLVIDFDPDGDHVIPMSVFMGDPPRSWNDFNFFPNLRPGDVDKMVCGWDAYPKTRSATATLPDRTDDPGFKYDPVANWYRAQGCSRLGIGETTLNNNEMVAQSLVDQWWAVKLPAWLDANEEVEVVALYDASGPAAGTNGYINTPGELGPVADLMLNGL